MHISFHFRKCQTSLTEQRRCWPLFRHQEDHALCGEGYDHEPPVWLGDMCPLHVGQWGNKEEDCHFNRLPGCVQNHYSLIWYFFYIRIWSDHLYLFHSLNTSIHATDTSIITWIILWIKYYKLSWTKSLSLPLAKLIIKNVSDI